MLFGTNAGSPVIRLAAHVNGVLLVGKPTGALRIRTRTSWPVEGYVDQERW